MLNVKRGGGGKWFSVKLSETNRLALNKVLRKCYSQSNSLLRICYNVTLPPAYHGGHGPRGVKGLIIYNFLQKSGFFTVNHSANGSKIMSQ